MDKKLGRSFGSMGLDVGRLLDDIQQGYSTPQSSGPISVSIDQIRPNPYQPRKYFDEKALQELSSSIALHGVFTPILLRKSISGYDLVAGERRWRASQIAGLKEIPAILVDFSEEQMMEISLLENIQREDLNAIEEAKAYQNLISELHYTQDQLAKRVGKSREHISNTLRLLKLPESVQQMVMSGQLSMGHVRALLSLKDKEKIEQASQKILKEAYSVRKTEQYVKTLLDGNNHFRKVSEKPKQPEAGINRDYYKLFLEEHLGLPVDVTDNSIRIHFQDKKELIRLIQNLFPEEENTNN